MSKIKCMVCGKELHKINSIHLKLHNLSMKEYREKFPDAPITSEELKKKYSEVQKKYSHEHPEKTRRGKDHYLYGKHPSQKTRDKLSKNNRMRNPEEAKKHSEIMKGKKFTKEHIENIIFSLKKYYKEHPEEIKGENNGNWKGGISYEPYCIKFDEKLKERVREFFGRCCYICGISESEMGYRLSVHHVNYNKMVCCNDVKPLFVPLCKKCHGKTQADREYWEEFFTISLKCLTKNKCFYTKEEMRGDIK